MNQYCDLTIKNMGIMGGTFNPPHNAHVLMAEYAVRSGKVDKVIFLPNGDPPHKELDIPAEERYKMTGLAIEDDPDFLLSDIESSRPGKSYMAETIRLLMEQYPGVRFSLIAGADMLAGISCWKSSEEILAEVSLIGFSRKGQPGTVAIERFLKRRGSDICFLDAEIPDISSTEIRKAVNEGRDISTLVPEKVAEYILEKGFYLENKAVENADG